MVCRELVPDVWTMTDGVEAACDELLAAAAATTGASTAKQSAKRAAKKTSGAKKRTLTTCSNDLIEQLTAPAEASPAAIRNENVFQFWW